MDIVTHGITGVLVSRALPGGNKKPNMIAGLLGALAPDLDALAGLWDPMAAIAVHRTLTHSFLGGGLVALALAAFMWHLSREKCFALAAVAYLGVLSHIGLDVLTPFGTAILWPLSNHRFALAQHHVIDLILSILALTFLLVTFYSKRRRTAWAKLALAGIALYVIVTGVHQRAAVSRWERFMDLQGAMPVRLDVVPLFPGPFRWLGIAETERVFYQTEFWLYQSRIDSPRVFVKTHELGKNLDQLPEVQLFLNFARFPWASLWYDSGFRVVEYRDLAFADHPLGGPIALQIWLDEFGAVRKMEFGHRF